MEFVNLICSQYVDLQEPFPLFRIRLETWWIVLPVMCVCYKTYTKAIWTISLKSFLLKSKNRNMLCYDLENLKDHLSPSFENHWNKSWLKCLKQRRLTRLLWKEIICQRHRILNTQMYIMIHYGHLYRFAVDFDSCLLYIYA